MRALYQVPSTVVSAEDNYYHNGPKLLPFNKLTIILNRLSLSATVPGLGFIALVTEGDFITSSRMPNLSVSYKLPNDNGYLSVVGYSH